MTTIAVVGDDLLAVAVARALAGARRTVTVHPVDSTSGGADDVAYIRLLSADPALLAQDAAALTAWAALERETGHCLTTRTDAVDVGLASTIATTLHETGAVRPARALHPVEASRLWPQIRFDGLVAHQPHARRVHLDPARRALVRSARARGVSFDVAATRVRTTPLGDVDVLVDGRWRRYDAAVVIADAAGRTRVVGQPTAADAARVLSVTGIGPPAAWPSVAHLSGLPDADGLVLPDCRAELHADRIELTVDQVSGDAAAQLWEYAVRWLPGTIVSAARVRAAAHGTPSLDEAQGRLAVTAPLAPRDHAFAPIVATDLAGRLLASLALDYSTERAS
jgi:plasmid stability protein